MRSAAFQLFGADHLLALGATVGLAVGAALWIRRDPEGRAARGIRIGLAAYLLGATAAALYVGSRLGALRLIDLLPFHLCDLAIFVAAFALISRRQGPYELLYFWALGGTLLAMATPDLGAGFPDLGCISFFGIHGGVVAAALILTVGFGMRPTPGAPLRVFLLTNAYAVMIGLVNVWAGTNYMYLCAEPSSPTLLDSLGPWPGYLVVADVLAFVLFRLLALPFRRAGV